VFIVAFFLSLSVTYHDFLPFYTESELMPGTIILSAPFVFFSLPRIRPKTAIIVLSAIFFTRLVYIEVASEKFIARRKWIYSELALMNKKNISKGYIDRSEINRGYYLSDWSTPQ